MLNNLDKRWSPDNALTRARDRHRQRMNDALIMTASPIAPVTTSIVKPIQNFPITPMVRLMGETTLQTRRRDIRDNLWAGTPAIGYASIADIDITNELSEWDKVGWEWSRRENRLNAYLTTGGKTYVVKIPLAKLQQIFNRCIAQEGGGPDEYIRATTIDGFFKKFGRTIKRGTKGIGRAIKNPKRFLKNSGKAIKKLVKGVGKTALNVVSSPIFAGAMTAIAAIPPLTAVGGAGLAAYAAANAIKPAFKALEAGVDTVDAISKKKKAGEIINNMKNGVSNMPGPAKKLMTGALKSVSDKQLTPKQRGRRKARAIFQLKSGRLFQRA